MDYLEQLKTIQWQQKREEILNRDNFHCQECFNKKYDSKFKNGIAKRLHESNVEGKDLYQVVVGNYHIELDSKLEIKDDKIYVYFNEPHWYDFVNYVALREVNDFDLRKKEYVEALSKRWDTDNLMKTTYFKLIEEQEITYIRLKEVQEMFDSMVDIVDEKARSILAKAFDACTDVKSEMMKKFNLKEDEYDYLIENDFTFSPKFVSPPSIDNIQKNYKWIEIKHLHIHHTYYQQGKYAWQYPNEALLTLCWDCHEELHENTEIEIKDVNGVTVGKKNVCSRCHGAGYIPKYSHVEQGICFSCYGEKIR